MTRTRFGLVALALTLACQVDFGTDTRPSGGTSALDDDDDGTIEQDCCTPHASPDCENPILSACVCEASPQCCEDGWNATCVAQLEALGCGQCGPPGTCCEEHGSPGCEVPALEQCVCEFDPVCCDEAWDPQCVADVFLFGCGMCPGVSGCCVADGAPGCDDAGIQACVCLEQPSCCAEGWDFQCVQAVESLGCGTCMRAAGSSGG